MIRVMVVDDHEMVRTGLEELLSAADDITVVTTADGGRAALAALARDEPDVVLMDISMPDLGGIETTRRIAVDHPEVRVVALTSFSDSAQVLGALDAGAVGYLLKDSTTEELRGGIRAAARGDSPLSPKAARAVLTARVHRRDRPELSPRERDVLRLVAEGLPNKLIARRLEIAEKTVKAHLTSIYQQLGVTDRTQAALWAHSHDFD